MNPILDLSDRLSVLPILHANGDFALEVRRHLTVLQPDCIALPLPPSFAEGPVEGAWKPFRISPWRYSAK